MRFAFLLTCFVQSDGVVRELCDGTVNHTPIHATDDDAALEFQVRYFTRNQFDVSLFLFKC